MFEQFEYSFDFNDSSQVNALKLAIATAFKDKSSTCNIEMNTHSLNSKTEKSIKYSNMQNKKVIKQDAKQDRIQLL